MASDLKPCAHCRGAAELDYEQSFRTFSSGKLEKQVAIYCTACDVHMSMCYSDFPEYDHDQMAAILTEKWNTRPAPAATHTGLVTVAWQRQSSFYADGWGPVDAAHAQKLAAAGEPVRELVTRSQAVGLLAAKDESVRDAKQSRDDWKKLAKDLQADNAAKDARVKYLEDAIKAKGGNEHSPTQDAYDLACKAIEKHRNRAEALEAKLAAAEKVRKAAEHVVWFDWSDNDDDAVKAVSDLRAVLEGKTV